MKKLTVLVGPAGSGKSSFSYDKIYDDSTNGLNVVYISQDSQGKERHKRFFQEALSKGHDIIIDRMNFNKEQRARYIVPAKELRYEVTIHVFHVPKNECLKRMSKREDHPTIKTSEDASRALSTFFSKYEKPTPDEGIIVNHGWDNKKNPSKAICVDLDGCLCNIEHRLHHVRGEGKKDWGSFFDEIPNDTVNEAVVEVLNKFKLDSHIILCSGRPDNHRRTTETWLNKHDIYFSSLLMRPRNDNRQDSIVKEIILDFEIKTQYDVLFWLDHRQQVVNKIRKNGIKVFQVAPGDF